MDCYKAEKLLHGWIDNELDEGERTALMAHLAECPACAGKLAEYRRLDALLKQLDEKTKVPAGLYGRIMDAVDREAAPSKSGTYRWTRWAASAAAMLLLGVTVSVLWRSGVMPAPMGEMKRYEMTQEAAPHEAPEAIMDTNDSGTAATDNEESMVMEAPTSTEKYGDDGAAMEVAWAIEARDMDRTQTPVDRIEAYCIEQELAVVESGPDWISVRWETDDEKQALLSFLEREGKLVMQTDDSEDASRIMLIRIQ